MKLTISELKEFISSIIKESLLGQRPEIVKGQAPKVGDWVYILGYDGGARRYETELRDGEVFYKKVQLTSARGSGNNRKVYYAGTLYGSLAKNVKVAVDQTSTNRQIA